MRSLIYIIVIFVGLVSKYQCVPVAQSTDTSQSGSAKTNPEYNLKLEFTEGDIVPHPLAGSVQGRGVAIRPAYQRWNGGIVPYEFAANLSSNDTAFIEKQMRAIENLTMVNNAQCVQFRPKNATDPYFITIFNGSGCSAPVGSWGAYVGVRPVSLLSGWYSTCMVSGIVQHELTHVLGLYHEQSRPDRDSYVSLQWANIIPAYVNNFIKYNDSDVDTQMTPYDYGSVMHYERDAFAVNSSGPTIIPIMNATAFIGQRVQLSPIDILEIQRYYGCVPTPTSTTTTTASPSVSTTTRTTTTTTPPSVSTTTRTTTTTTASPSVSTTTRTTTTTTASPSVSTTTRTTTTTTASPSVSTTTRTTTTSNNNGNSSSSPTTAAAGFANNAGIPNAFSLHGEMYAVCFTFALYLINSIH